MADKDIPNLIQDYLNGSSIQTLGWKYKVSESCVLYILRTNNVEFRPYVSRKLSQKHLDYILANYMYKTLKELANDVGVSNTLMTFILTRHGLSAGVRGSRLVPRFCKRCGVKLDEKNNNPSCRSNCKKCERERHRVMDRMMKLKIVSEYGGKCQCPGCNIDFPEFLTIDHKYDDGKEHRKQINFKNIYRWLELNGFPKDRFELKCMNCNWAKGRYGVCPHVKRTILVNL